MTQPAFGLANSFSSLDIGGDPRRNLKEPGGLERFRPELEAARTKNVNPMPAGSLDVILMFKVLVLHRCIIFG